MTSIKASPWIAYARINPQADLRLFCFPYAGGAASIFRIWSHELRRDIEICPIQLPGRENRLGEPPFTRLPPLVDALAQTLQPYLDKPFALFGHSMGALISFELARQLRKKNSPGPVHLFVSGRRAPQIPSRNLPMYQLPEAEFAEELRRFNGTPEAVLRNAELMQLLLPSLRADFSTVETYVYTTELPLECPISAFGGLQDKQVTRDDLAAWHCQTSGTFTLRILPGDHFFLHSAWMPLLQAISHDLTQLLD